jgi:hypothetical protein
MHLTNEDTQRTRLFIDSVWRLSNVEKLEDCGIVIDADVNYREL